MGASEPGSLAELPSLLAMCLGLILRLLSSFLFFVSPPNLDMSSPSSSSPRMSLPQTSLFYTVDVPRKLPAMILKLIVVCFSVF